LGGERLERIEVTDLCGQYCLTPQRRLLDHRAGRYDARTVEQSNCLTLVALRHEQCTHEGHMAANAAIERFDVDAIEELGSFGVPPLTVRQGAFDQLVVDTKRSARTEQFAQHARVTAAQHVDHGCARIPPVSPGACIEFGELRGDLRKKIRLLGPSVLAFQNRLILENLQFAHELKRLLVRPICGLRDRRGRGQEQQKGKRRGPHQDLPLSRRTSMRRFSAASGWSTILRS
jgi:hypothetical protein